jgi:hypothetical protein
LVHAFYQYVYIDKLTTILQESTTLVLKPLPGIGIL